MYFFDSFELKDRYGDNIFLTNSVHNTGSHVFEVIFSLPTSNDLWSLLLKLLFTVNRNNDEIYKDKLVND